MGKRTKCGAEHPDYPATRVHCRRGINHRGSHAGAGVTWDRPKVRHLIEVGQKMS